MSIPVGTLGTSESLSIGGRVFTDLTNLIVLRAQSVGTAGHYNTFRKLNGTAGYQVTAGKTLTILAIKWNNLVASAGAGSTLLYGTNDVGLDSASAPTGATFQFGTSSGTAVVEIDSNATSIHEADCNFQVPAADYPAMYSLGTGQQIVTIYGYET